jgi:hypothetical protein
LVELIKSYYSIALDINIRVGIYDCGAKLSVTKYFLNYTNVTPFFK